MNTLIINDERMEITQNRHLEAHVYPRTDDPSLFAGVAELWENHKVIDLFVTGTVTNSQVAQNDARMRMVMEYNRLTRVAK
jgi:hypothetical protein